MCVALLVADEGKGKIRLVTNRGREVRVPDSRIVNVSGLMLDPAGDPNVLGKTLDAHEAELRARAEDVDVASLWEVLADDGGAYSLDDLAELALGSREGTARSIVLRRLVQDDLYFSRKKNDFAPRSREELGETVKRKRAEEQRAQDRAAFVAHARAGLAHGAAAREWGAGAKRFLDALRDVAIFGGDSERLKEGLALLGELGVASRAEPELAAFDVLVRLGVMPRDYNLLLERHGVVRAFAPEVIAEAERVARAGVPTGSRRDLTALVCYAVDDAQTSEVDDAISLEDLGGGRARLGVHIADPEPYIPHGGLLDLAARERATTYYLPEERILMLPGAVSEGIGSLTAGEPRTALSFLFDLEADGRLLAHEVFESVIRVASRIDYEQTDTLIALGGGAPRLDEPLDGFAVPAVDDATRARLPALPAGAPEMLARAARLARALLERRAAAGALILKGPDLDVKVERGVPRVRRLEPWTPAWTLVSEAMVLTNVVGGRILRDRDVPGIFRRQSPPERTLSVPRDYDPAAAAAVRRLLRPTDSGLTPGPHAALGVDVYVQCSSPLRRYQDLACHRQLKAALRGEKPPFDREAMQRVAATTEAAERAARTIERGNREYWILRWLELQPSELVLDAVVTRPEERRTLIEIHDLVYHASIQPRPEHKPGRKVRVVVDAVEPRAARLVVREV